MERGFDIVHAAAIAAVLVAKIAVVLGVISDGEDPPRRLHRSRSTFKEALRPFPDWGHTYMTFTKFLGFLPSHPLVCNS